MAVKKVNPTSPGRRFQVYSTFKEVTRSTPEKNLLKALRKSGGRNANGRITSRHKGGGHKRHYRIIDFKRDKIGIPAKVASIEYDPNRSTRIALLHYTDGEKRYILAPLHLTVNDVVMSGPEADIKPGNTLPLSNIPLGTHIHNIELRVGGGGKDCQKRRDICSADGKGRSVCARQTSFQRGSHGSFELQSNRWTAWKCGSRESISR